MAASHLLAARNTKAQEDLARALEDVNRKLDILMAAMNIGEKIAEAVPESEPIHPPDWVESGATVQAESPAKAKVKK